VAIAASATLGLGLAQVALGALTVSSGLAPVLRSLHQANGAMLAAALVGLTYVSFLKPQAEPKVTALRDTIADYVTLTKPKVMSLLLFTTLASMLIAKAGLPSLRLVLATLIGGALAAGSSGAINMYLDRDIDAKMKRTARRPIPSGRMPARRALVFGLALGVGSFAIFAAFVNLLAAALASLGILYYVVIYTIWLKRSTPQNIVIGGAAGSIPPLVGWAAVTDHVGLTALLLFLVIFVWTPPHFWALSLMAKTQYAQAGIPMLPVVRGDDETKRQIIIYSIALIALTIVFVPLRVMGIVYLTCALALDAVFLYYALRVAKEGSVASERRLYSYSMVYLALLFVAMVVDRILRGTGA
jgi:heme o synthase